MLAWAATALLGTAGLRWLQLMRQVRLPADATAFVLVTTVAVLLGGVGLAAGAGPAGSVAAGCTIVGGLAFLALFAASGQIAATPAVTVGGPILDFTAADDEGRPFSLAALRGRPVLLKFFRGHWCPYCVAELRRWTELQPALDARGIAVVTVCVDRAEEIRASRAKHGLRATMLPDPDLTLTDGYGLRNPKNFAPRPGLIIPLPIPTTILVDAAGIVRWIDQSTDYMRRSDPARVLAAIERLRNVERPGASQHEAPQRRERRRYADRSAPASL